MLASTLLIGDRESEELVAASAIREVEHHASLRDRIGKSLSAAIMSWELEPGALVTVPTLALQFAVSATPVREALLDLKQRGFVSSVRNKGFRVTAVSAEDLGEIVELRQWLEVPAMRDLATDFPMSAMPHWRGVADAISVHAKNAELTEFIESDREFHLGLLALRGNKRLVELVGELRSQTRMVNLVRMTHSRELAEVAQEHHRMLDLLASGDAAALATLTRNHLAHVVDWWGRERDQPES
ncbi:MAG: GntR family transcriptional regulator [Terrimesophilobacter sp.]